jgi:hypothetical protein
LVGFGNNTKRPTVSERQPESVMGISN